MKLLQAFGQFAGQAAPAPVPAADFELITRVNFSGVSAITIDDCFSARYDYYMFISNALMSAGAVGSNMKLRVSGVNTTGTDYRRQYFEMNDTSSSQARFTGEEFFRNIIGQGQTVETGNAIGWIVNPFKAVPTSYWPNHITNTNGNITIRNDVGTHDLSTSYTGIYIEPISGTTTGDISIYGWVA